MKFPTKFVISAVVFAASAYGVSCNRSNGYDARENAHALFTDTKTLIAIYTDSLHNVADSASFRRMKRDFNDRMTKVNYHYPPDTDLLLSEEQNDSIIMMLNSIVALFRVKEQLLENVRNDTVDSVQVVNTSISQSAQLK